ncbi:aminotransferase class I/II-fold pyridoxal phosphate-dependent enzyme [Schaedlerella arabinosiphila]|uniref:Aminotransferase class I/II-fold pyridoxal phosphate-dependent enzyme n=1 Tax=Schaedlerella arabinosiphila TaxID=2044587 RepID=A0A426DMT4_9FIRM|nr:aminotransferase class I/II-fold pyridoxal phosphate-dependent enzyme [Schaedlerella arabinosiphila]RRK34107.1 aminotransferase class I/II-fold pyridoxal phosphate-dependent enzyme [Schaedlerella arabinosiphila]
MENLYEKLSSYAESDYYGFHMPGHKRNRNVTGVSLPYGIDITEIEGFDDLHHAKGFLKQAQERAAEVFHGEETCFLINGSTVGILSAVLGCTQRGDKILMARNCHKSVYHAVYMNELEAEYLYPVFDRELNGEVRPEDVQRILEEERIIAEKGKRTNSEMKKRVNSEREKRTDSEMKKRVNSEKKTRISSEKEKIRAVVITSPTYDGVVSDVARIAEIVHAYGIPLIVDEAHGAHFGFHPYFPENSNVKGADVVIHSIHKTLPALTQTALIHMNGIFADREKIKKYLHILQTSSPSYILMAGIDACVGWLGSEKKDAAFDDYVKLLKETRNQLKKLRHLQMIETENFDFSKIVISVKGTRYSGRELYKLLLEKYHLQMEMAAGTYVLAMTSVGDIREGFQRLVQALHEIDGNLEKENGLPLSGIDRNLEKENEPILSVIVKKLKEENPWPLSESELTLDSENGGIGLTAAGIPRLEQVFSSSKAEQAGKQNPESVSALPWSCCCGKISMEYAYIYPPGIPLIVPGERISEEVIARIEEYSRMGFDIEGMNKSGYITIMDST